MTKHGACAHLCLAGAPGFGRYINYYFAGEVARMPSAAAAMRPFKCAPMPPAAARRLRTGRPPVLPRAALNGLTQIFRLQRR